MCRPRREEVSGRPVCGNILAVLVESLNHPCNDLLRPGCIVRFQLSEKLEVFHADPVRFESVARGVPRVPDRGYGSHRPEGTAPRCAADEFLKGFGRVKIQTPVQEPLQVVFRAGPTDIHLAEPLLIEKPIQPGGQVSFNLRRKSRHEFMQRDIRGVRSGMRMEFRMHGSASTPPCFCPRRFLF